MRSQARRAKPRPKPAKRKGPSPDIKVKGRNLSGYVAQDTRAHPDKWTEE